MPQRRWKLLAFAAAAAAAQVVAAGAGSESSPLVGGTYRVGIESARGGQLFRWSDGFDPTGEYDVSAMGIYSNLLLRTLVGYDHVAGAAGTRLVPDLAVSVPTPTNGGRTYTFRLKRGIRFGPPVDREITSSDIRYAIERLARPRNGAQYAFYFDVIQGFDACRSGISAKPCWSPRRRSTNAMSKERRCASGGENIRL